MTDAPVYYRSSGSRFLALCGVILPAIFLFVVVPGERAFSWGVAVLLLFLLAGLVYSVVAFGDRFTVDHEGLHRHNPLLSRFGLRSSWNLSFRDIRSQRFHKEKIIFLHPFKGRTWILEGIDGLDILHKEIDLHLQNHRAKLDQQ